MKLLDDIKKWVNQRRAVIKSYTAPYEWGGILYDYKNGDLEQIFKWETDKEMETAGAMILQMVGAGRDVIYIAVVKCGPTAGYFVIHDSNGGWWEKHFAPGIYPPEVAYSETMAQCRKIATKMGFRDRSVV